MKMLVARLLYDWRPLRPVGLEHGHGLRLRADHRRHAGVLELALRVRVLHDFADGGGQLLDLGLGHGGRREEGVPAGGGQVEAGFLEGGNVRRERRALGARQRQDAQLARRVLRQHHVFGVDGNGHLPADQVVQQRRGAAVADHLCLHVGLLAHHEPEEVRQAAGGRHAHVGLGWVGAHPREQVAQFAHGQGGRHGEREVVVVDVRHGHEVALGVVVVVLEDQRRHHHDGGVGEHQHVLVGGRDLHLLRREAAARAGLVVDDDRHAQLGAELVGHHARHAVGGAAGRIADHDVQRAVELGLRHGAGGKSRREAGDGQQADKAVGGAAGEGMGRQHDGQVLVFVFSGNGQ